ncbi:hypothetical protein B0T24DRAFT_599797 [Lasiosphaeria ovina]|uniref:C2H2-type domain-containing protein n=1 Tax=Lasiosphaeria ovina TaxID=92902 RepID=A0AAE0JTW0_9PEZI|nr:hypothetical protein B0T24DRAFT_599797 [Lasiosphaeria ovina]
MYSSQRWQRASRRTRAATLRPPPRRILPAPQTTPPQYSTPPQDFQCFIPNFMFPESYNLPYTTPSGGSGDTYSGSSDGRSNTFSTDVCDSRYPSFEPRALQDTSYLLFPENLTSEPATLFNSYSDAVYRQPGSRSVPTIASQPLAPDLPLQYYSSDDARRYHCFEAQAHPPEDPSRLAHVPTANRSGDEQANHAQSTSLESPSWPRKLRCNYRDGNKKCGYFTTGKDPDHLLKIHQRRQHQSSPIRCNEEGCGVIIGHGRRDNLNKHKNTENCAGFKRKKAAEAAQATEKHMFEELATLLNNINNGMSG